MLTSSSNLNNVLFFEAAVDDFVVTVNNVTKDRLVTDVTDSKK